VTGLVRDLTLERSPPTLSTIEQRRRGGGLALITCSGTEHGVLDWMAELNGGAKAPVDRFRALHSGGVLWVSRPNVEELKDVGAVRQRPDEAGCAADALQPTPAHRTKAESGGPTAVFTGARCLTVGGIEILALEAAPAPRPRVVGDLASLHPSVQGGPADPEVGDRLIDRQPFGHLAQSTAPARIAPAGLRK
jgi:hypothetical protein